MLSDRELDLLVAQHVFAWRRAGDNWYTRSSRSSSVSEWPITVIPGHDECDYKGAHDFLLPPDFDGEDRESRGVAFCGCQGDAEIPAYSTTGDGLLAVVEKMRERGFWVSLTTRRIAGDDFLAKVWNFDVERTAEDPSAPRAVAISALRALGVTVDA